MGTILGFLGPVPCRHLMVGEQEDSGIQCSPMQSAFPPCRGGRQKLQSPSRYRLLLAPPRISISHSIESRSMYYQGKSGIVCLERATVATKGLEHSELAIG